MMWLSVRNLLQEAEESAPKLNFKAMYGKLPEKETELERILNSGSYNMPLDLMRYMLSTFRAAYRLAGQII